MTDEQEQDLLQIKDDFAILADAKYRAGAAEHGGNVWDMNAEQLIDQALSEAVDQIVYLLHARHKIRRATDLGREVLSHLRPIPDMENGG